MWLLHDLGHLLLPQAGVSCHPLGGPGHSLQLKLPAMPALWVQLGAELVGAQEMKPSLLVQPCGSEPCG